MNGLIKALPMALVLLVACTKAPEVEMVASPADEVSTLVGTMSDYSLSTGNTYPATATPWGMNFWTPMTTRPGDGWTYSYTSHKITGFKETHQPSPWINDYGQICVMPLKDASKSTIEERASFFSHKSEIAKPYYYSVYLADQDTEVEMSPTDRAVVMRFTYPESEVSGFILDAYDPDGSIKVVDDHTIIGYTSNNHGGVPDNFRSYFIAHCDKAFDSYEVNGDKLVVTFKTQKGEQVNLNMSSSFISPEQASVNLREVGGKSLEQVRDEARNRWNDILGRIEIGGGTEEQIRTFYSCLYRATLFPRKFYEIAEDGSKVHYSPYDGQVHEGTLYTDSGFWDVFRCLFPLLNLVYPDVNAEIQEGLVNISHENEFLPEWASPGHRGCMVGNNSASIIADAAVLGVNAEGLQDLYDALVYGTEHVHPNANSSGRLGHEWYNSLGYIPYNVGVNENVARTLEYAYDDWCIMKLAQILGRPQEEIDLYASRAMNYKNVFDSQSMLMRGRNEDGSFQEPFSPYKWGDAFTEGNAWHYTWSVFHDVQGLVDLMGGKDQFVSMLDSVFVVPPVYDDSYYGQRIHEITEMQIADMGNYAHGNQPVQHITYLYDYAGEPWKAQIRTRETMDKLYSSAPDGYCGDEDNGQTSAWYVFSALGFYPVCPGSGEYAIGSPLFKEARIHFQNGKTLEISAPDNAADTPYISSLKVNGEGIDRNYLTYKELTDGAKLQFDMSDKPNLKRGTSSDDVPYSFSSEK